MKETIDRFTTRSTTRSGWWALGLGLSALLVGPLLGFGLIGLLLVIATLATGTAAFRRGERSWMLWLGAGLAVGVACYLPFMSTEYPYTNP